MTDKQHRPARKRVSLPARCMVYGQQQQPVHQLKPASMKPLHESLVETLVHRRTKPPLPKQGPPTRSSSSLMIADFLRDKCQHDQPPDEYQPKSYFGRGCTPSNSSSRNLPTPWFGHRSRPGTGPGPPACCRSASQFPVSANNGEFSIIRVLMDEVLASSKKSRSGKRQQHQQQAQQQDDHSQQFKIASSPRWRQRPASAPLLQPQNLCPSKLAEKLAEKKRNFLKKRPATAPLTKPMFHLPLSRVNMASRRSSKAASPAAAAGQQQHPSVPVLTTNESQEASPSEHSCSKSASSDEGDDDDGDDASSSTNVSTSSSPSSGTHH